MNDIALIIAHVILSVIMAGVALTWMWLLHVMHKTFTMTPRLGECPPSNHSPLVSVILPARNEESYIDRCISSLRNQDYANYEIIAIDDSSTDSTSDIIARHAAADSNVIHVSAQPKPDGWAGKSWACSEGYKAARGELLLFTDADTVHAHNTISSAVSDMLGLGLDVLTVMPKMRCDDWWAKISLPVISVFLHTRFSALKVNDPANKMGYFFGSFFIIMRKSYERLGTHSGVRGQIVEDGALGRLAKAAKMNIRMVRGENAVSAVWSRDLRTLWNALKRLMIPLYLQTGIVAIGILVGVAFVVFLPFVIFAYSVSTLMSAGADSYALMICSLGASVLAMCGALYETRFLGTSGLGALGAPLGGLVITLGFLTGILRAHNSDAVSWRGRTYAISEIMDKESESTS